MIRNQCPIWSPEKIEPVQEWEECSQIYYSAQAGGRFRLTKDAVPLLQTMQDDQRVCLSYWIFHCNRLYPNTSPIVLSCDQIYKRSNCALSLPDLRLSFIRELVNQFDQGYRVLGDGVPRKPEHDRLLFAASGCLYKGNSEQFVQHCNWAEYMGYIKPGRLFIGGLPYRISHITPKARQFLAEQD